jgi:hypothetical protein
MADLKKKQEVRLKLVRGPDDQVSWTLVDSQRADAALLHDLKSQLGDALVNVETELEFEEDEEEFEEVEEVKEEEEELDEEDLTDQQREVLEALEDEGYEELEDDFVFKAEGEEVEEVFEEYDDEEIGAPEVGGVNSVSKAEFEAAMQEFIEEHPELLRKKKEHPLDVIGPVEYDHLMQAAEAIDSDYEEYYTQMAVRAPEDPWDVESVTSTYTNTDNRPKVISVTSATAKLKPKEVHVPPPLVEVKKPQDSKEPLDKKARKTAVKLERRENRKAKKELKQLYSVEQRKQGSRLAGRYDAPQGIAVHKL